MCSLWFKIAQTVKCQHALIKFVNFHLHSVFCYCSNNGANKNVIKAVINAPKITIKTSWN